MNRAVKSLLMLVIFIANLVNMMQGSKVIK
jgi:hypothetical protein